MFAPADLLNADYDGGVKRLVQIAVVIGVVCLSGHALAFRERPSKGARRPSRRASARLTPAPEPKTLGYAPIVLSETERRYVGEPISLDLKDADLKDVLLTFGKLARVNVAIDPEVRGSVTVSLHDVPWDEALDLILKTNGLGYILEGNVVRIATPGKLEGGP